MGDPNAKPPIYSTRADDPALGAAIQAFVVGLAERIDDLQDGEAQGELGGVAARARALGTDSDRLGFEVLRDAAGRLASACGGDDRDAVHEAVVDVTEIAQRIRQGHRGAA
jgi:hypothetical protein